MCIDIGEHLGNSGNSLPACGPVLGPARVVGPDWPRGRPVTTCACVSAAGMHTMKNHVQGVCLSNQGGVRTCKLNDRGGPSAR